MKIFISHASANKDYGNALVDLLRAVNVQAEDIIFTSNTAYGIPIGKDIFLWLKSQIAEKPFVIYLLSIEYYKSIACLNEMGAAWVIENEHAVIFTPDFDITGKEFQNGAINPREIGFTVNDEERLLSFIFNLKVNFPTITEQNLLIIQSVKRYLKTINDILDASQVVKNKLKAPPTVETVPIPSINSVLKEIGIPTTIAEKEVEKESEITVSIPIVKKLSTYEKFVNDIANGKLKSDELLLLHYVIDVGRSKLMTGWQEDKEIEKILAWEDVNELQNTLSSKYASIINRLEMRGYTEVSDITGSGNAKEIRFKPEIESKLMDLPEIILEKISNALIDNSNNGKESNDFFTF